MGSPAQAEGHALVNLWAVGGEVRCCRGNAQYTTRYGSGAADEAALKLV